MKFSKHVETCFVRANDDFDDKSTYIYCFLNKKKILDKNPPKRTLCAVGRKLNTTGKKRSRNRIFFSSACVHEITQ